MDDERRQAIADGRTTLGMVRLKCRDAASQLAVLLAQSASREPSPADALETGWALEVADEIDRLFAD